VDAKLYLDSDFNVALSCQLSCVSISEVEILTSVIFFSEAFLPLAYPVA